MEKENGKAIVRVGLLTPYLTYTFDEVKRELGEKKAGIQKKKYGYAEDNLSGYVSMVTDRHKVVLEKRGQEFSGILPHLAISGCTETGEEEVRKFRGSGIIFARYSIFYGEPSRYTGHKPEDSGYAFDIPKTVDAVKKMLTHDGLLEGIVQREEKKIVAALKSISKDLDRPIIATPYLKIALKHALQ